MKRGLLLGLLAGMLFSPAARAEVTLVNGDKLGLALKNSPPCCVIDARTALKRAQVPVVDALPYRSGLRIKPTATVVVLADSDREALRIASIYERQHPGKAIIAVKGGGKAWLAATALPDSSPAADGAPGSTLQFVIPHNTCETGEPLQKLQSNKK